MASGPLWGPHQPRPAKPIRILLAHFNRFAVLSGSIDPINANSKLVAFYAGSQKGPYFVQGAKTLPPGNSCLFEAICSSVLPESECALLHLLDVTVSGCAGSIPAGLASLPTLQYLDLARNNLTDGVGGEIRACRVWAAKKFFGWYSVAAILLTR